jgi:hypothetical protein
MSESATPNREEQSRAAGARVPSEARITRGPRWKLVREGEGVNRKWVWQLADPPSRRRSSSQQE